MAWIPLLSESSSVTCLHIDFIVGCADMIAIWIDFGLFLLE